MMWLLTNNSRAHEVAIHNEKIPFSKENEPRQTRQATRKTLQRRTTRTLQPRVVTQNEEEIEEEEVRRMLIPLMRKHCLASSSYIDQANAGILDSWYLSLICPS